MDESSTTTGTLDQIDEDMLTYTLSDEALEAAAGTERGPSLLITGYPTSYLAACKFVIAD